MSKKTSTSPKPEKKTLLNPLHELIELGHSQGYVTFSNILNFIPDAKKDVSSLEKAFAALLKEDIPYLEEDDEEEIESIIVEEGGNGKPEDEEELSYQKMRKKNFPNGLNEDD